MINITLKANHFYFITYQLKNSTIEQYFSLVNRIKTALAGNNDLDLSFTISATPDEVITMFRILTVLPEGMANKINTEMDDLLLPQIALGIADEQAAGTGPDADGNLPANAYWQITAKGITEIKDTNTLTKNNYITLGKSLIDQI
jgi:hypothetical protein